MEAKASKGSWKWAVTAVLALLVMLIPTNAVFTEDLRLFFTITVTIICVFAFELLPTLAGAVLLSAAYIISGLVPAEVALAPWTNTLIYMTLGAFILANVMEECGLLQRICLWCIAKSGGTFNLSLIHI